jgi:rhodanese-related sulfurtransferase
MTLSKVHGIYNSKESKFIFSAIIMHIQEVTMLRRSIIYLAVFAAFGSSAAIAEYMGDISAQEAFERASKEANVYILDVRTGQEWRWVGHPGPNGLADSEGEGLAFKSGAGLDGKVANIAYRVDDGAGGLVPNVAFDTAVNSRFSTDDILLTLCRTGGRALSAAQDLGALGYTTYRIEHGFQGDANDDTKPGPDTLYRDVNGWVNNKLPYNGNAAGAYYPD